MALRNSSADSWDRVSPAVNWSDVSSQSTLPSFLAMKPSRLAAMWIVTRDFAPSIATPFTLAAIDHRYGRCHEQARLWSVLFLTPRGILRSRAFLCLEFHRTGARATLQGSTRGPCLNPAPKYVTLQKGFGGTHQSMGDREAVQRFAKPGSLPAREKPATGGSPDKFLDQPAHKPSTWMRRTIPIAGKIDPFF